jgi:antitoxin component of MazEF toxin-antitoxin module
MAWTKNSKSSKEDLMIVATRKADGRARIVLPEDFANTTVVVERIGANELRLRKKKSLKQLLAGVTPQNIHAAVDTGSAVGKEVL